jgi:peptide chain release factor
MISFAVSEEKNQWLQAKMEGLGIREKDIEEKFIRSSGRGGQKVNKTSSCVYLRHIPTGIEVKCMRERSQSLNRFLARRELLSRIESHSGPLPGKELEIQKIRRRKSRSRRRGAQKSASTSSGTEGSVAHG